MKHLQFTQYRFTFTTNSTNTQINIDNIIMFTLRNFKLSRELKLVLITLIVTLISLYFDKMGFLSPYLRKINFFSKSEIDSLFSPSELELYDGIHKPEIYLAILGNVFDVTKGAKHYGPGQAYNVFAGRDASRNFVSGKFEKTDLTDDVVGLNQQELRSLNNWYKFYTKDYKQVGKLVGRYYNIHGEITPYGKEINKLLNDAEKAKETENLDKIKFPPCNVEWNAETGSKVWCTDRSGGIERNWIGVPRKLFEPGSNDFRCACIQESQLNSLGNIKQYEGCDGKAVSCYVK